MPVRISRCTRGKPGMVAYRIRRYYLIRKIRAQYQRSGGILLGCTREDL